MNIRNILQTAPRRLENASQEKRIALIYAGITTGAAVLVTFLSYVLDLRISQLGGLSTMSQRSILETIQSILPTAQMVVLMCLELGYVNAMLRFAREQYVSPQSLRLGFARFGSLIRATILESLIYMAVGMASFFAAAQIYLFTPYADRLVEILGPYTNSLISLSSTPMLDEAVQMQAVTAMIPLFVIFGVLALALFLPIHYQYRMVKYVIIDNPGIGGIAALRASRKIMRRNRFRLFQLDLGLWWYHLICLAAMGVCYGDTILALLGIPVNIHPDVLFYSFYAAYLAIQFVVCIFLRSRVEVSYALAYEALRPKPQQTGEVVLGNIFQM